LGLSTLFLDLALLATVGGLSAAPSPPEETGFHDHPSFKARNP
jgi:hypothetical protein